MKLSFLFGLLPFGDIADGAGDESALSRFERAQSDFNGKLSAILAAAVKVQVGSHSAGPWCVSIILAMPGVFPVEAVRNEDFDRLAEQFFPRIAEQLFRLRICEHDAALFVDDHDCIGR